MFTLMDFLCRISTHSLTKRLTHYCFNSYHPSTISTHSLTKRLTVYTICRIWKQCISTHSLTKRLTITILDIRNRMKYFNSQPHEEADDQHVIMLVNNGDFNSQPHEEADLLVLPLPAVHQYFNSQPHEEADGSCNGE